MTTLIIGSNGYIGSRLFQELVEINPIGLDLNWFADPNQNVIVKDYRDLDKDFLQNFQHIVLLAGHSSVRMCDGPLQDVWYNNINNFLNLVHKLNKSQLLIYASSGSVYGAMNGENYTFVPINNYDLTKYTLDLHASKLIEQGYNIVGLRLGTVNGYSNNFRSDLMINSMIVNSMKHKEIPLNNISVKRPILSITDLCAAIKTIIDNPIPGIYDLCSFSATVEEIGLTVADKLGVPVSISQNINNVYNFTFTNNRFQEIFNFKFKSDIKSIISEIESNFDKQLITNRNEFKNYK